MTRLKAHVPGLVMLIAAVLLTVTGDGVLFTAVATVSILAAVVLDAVETRHRFRRHRER